MFKAAFQFFTLLMFCAGYGHADDLYFMSHLPHKEIHSGNCAIEGLRFPKSYSSPQLDDQVLYLERGTDYQEELGLKLCDSSYQLLSLTSPNNSVLTIDFDDSKSCPSTIKGMIKSTRQTDDIQMNHPCFRGRIRLYEHRIQLKSVSPALKIRFLKELGVALDDAHELTMTCESRQGQQVIDCPYEE